MRRIFSPTVLLTMALMSVIVMMILPMPAWVLDIGLAASFSFAILIFTVTLFVERPLDFSRQPNLSSGKDIPAPPPPEKSSKASPISL